MEAEGALRVLGTAQLCNRYGILGKSAGTTSDQIQRFLLAAQSLEFRVFDTAPSYPGAEEALGAFVPSAAIHTKLDAGREVEDSLLGSLQRLRRSRVDVAYLHDPMAPISEGGRAISQAAHFKGTYFDHLGTSVYSVDALSASLNRSEIGVIQIPINPLWRELLNILPTNSSERPMIVGRSLLAQGLLVIGADHLPPEVRHLRPYIQAFEDACREIERSTIEVAILWSRDQESLDGHIIGATSIEQLQQIASAFEAPALTFEERAVIDNIPLPSTTLFDPRTWT